MDQAIDHLELVLLRVDRYSRRQLHRIVELSINEILRAYGDALANWVVDAANGNVKVGGIASKWRSLLLEDARAVYIEGMREGGIEDPESEIDDADEAAIGDWVLTQTPHIYGFADDAVAVSKLEGDERTAARDAMLARVDTWVASLGSLGQLAIVNMKGNPMLTFLGDDGIESCAECQRYKGQRHKKSWWDSRGLLKRNGNENYGCQRFDSCQHFHYYDDGSLAL